VDLALIFQAKRCAPTLESAMQATSSPRLRKKQSKSQAGILKYLENFLLSKTNVESFE
jgi:hypothetical protein